MPQNLNTIYNLLIETLNRNNIIVQFSDFDCFAAIAERRAGRQFSNEQHLEGIVFSLLSSQRPWKPILVNKQNIKDIFNNFDYQYVLNKDPEYFEQEIKKIKCGNKSIHRQMQALHDIVSKLNYIKEKHDSLDNFVNLDTPMNIAKMISSNKEYKIPELGFALALEYLRNVGIDIAKPDSQLCRLFGRERLGLSQRNMASPDEVVSFIEKIAQSNKISEAEIGTTFWTLCAKDYGNICSQKPKCEKCNLYSACNIKKEIV